MSNFKRQAIVSIAAIAGAQLAGILLSPSAPGQSSSCLQWASESISAAQQNMQYAVNPPPTSEGTGYYDVRTKRDEPTYPVGQYEAAAPVPTAAAGTVTRTQGLPVSAAAAAVAPPIPTASAPTAMASDDEVRRMEEQIDRRIAQANGMTLQQYKAHPEVADPLAGMADPLTGMPRSTAMPQSSTNYSCAWYKGKRYCGEG